MCVWSQRFFNVFFNITVLGMEIEEIISTFLETGYKFITTPSPQVKIRPITKITQATLSIIHKT